MELVFRLIDELRQEVVAQVVNPPEDKQTEFHFGRIHGQMFILGTLEERLKDALDNHAAQQQRLERDFS